MSMFSIKSLNQKSLNQNHEQHWLLGHMTILASLPSRPWWAKLLESGPSFLSTGGLARERQGRGSVEVRVCVGFAFREEWPQLGTEWRWGSGFCPCCRRSAAATGTWKKRHPEKVLLGLRDAEATEGALQLLVVHGRNGEGRVAPSIGGVLRTTPLPPVTSPAEGAALLA